MPPPSLQLLLPDAGRCQADSFEVSHTEDGRVYGTFSVGGPAGRGAARRLSAEPRLAVGVFRGGRHTVAVLHMDWWERAGGAWLFRWSALRRPLVTDSGSLADAAVLHEADILGEPDPGLRRLKEEVYADWLEAAGHAPLAAEVRGANQQDEARP